MFIECLCVMRTRYEQLKMRRQNTIRAAHSITVWRRNGYGRYLLDSFECHIRLFIHFRHIPATYTACITKCVHTHTAMDKKFPLKCFSGELLSGPKLQQQQKKHFLHCSRNTRIQHRQWFGAHDNTASPIRHRTVFHPPQHTETISYTNERDTHRKYAKEQHEHKFFVWS